MIIGKYIPDNAIQVRYVHPQYEQDEDGNEYVWNEEEMTDVEALIREVNRNQIPLYYRRRVSDYAREDTRRWNRYINDNNRHYKDSLLYVRVKKVGRRVLVVYDKAYWDKILASGKKITSNMGAVNRNNIRHRPRHIVMSPDVSPDVQESIEDFVRSLDENTHTTWGEDHEER
jgi:RNase P protein component